MGQGYTREEWIQFQNRWIIRQDEETFEKYKDRIIYEEIKRDE